MALRRLRGRRVILTFWQSWSAPCVTELKRLLSRYDEVGRGTTLDLFLDIFNLTDRANFNNPSGDLRLRSSLQLRTLRGGSGFPRQAQFGVRFGF